MPSSGAVSGLAMTEGSTEFARSENVVVFERREYDDKRVNCNRAIGDTTLITLGKTTENGFLSDIENLQLRTYEGTKPRLEGDYSRPPGR